LACEAHDFVEMPPIERPVIEHAVLGGGDPKYLDGLAVLEPHDHLDVSRHAIVVRKLAASAEEAVHVRTRERPQLPRPRTHEVPDPDTHGLGASMMGGTLARP
jgi:hypothetical protein